MGEKQDDSANYRASIVGELRSAKVRREILDPQKKPYLKTISQCLHPLLLAEESISFFRPSSEEILSCEQHFVEEVLKGLEKEGGKKIVGGREVAFKEVLKFMPSYSRQVVGWSVNRDRYIYLKFRRESVNLPPLSEEYTVRDGGHNFFELQCKLDPVSLFNIFVHGDA